MKDKINSYFAVLLITIIGSGAALLIVDIGTSVVVASTISGHDANYAALEQSLLKNNR